MNNEGYTWKAIKKHIEKAGYKGSDSLLRKYIAKIRKGKIEEKEIKQIVERSTMISLLYKEIDKVKNIKRTMYGRCGFALLKQKVLLQY